METIAERLESALHDVRIAIQESHRASNSVQLLAVSKTKPVSDIVQAYEAGQRLFGENYVQEGVEKIKKLQAFSDIEWHFIGPLQSNKTRPVAESFDWVQSLDRLKIAQRLNEQRTPHKKLNVCIQVNISDDPAKAGIMSGELMEFAGHIAMMPNLNLRGLMTIPAAGLSEHELRQNFDKMYGLFEGLQQKYPQCDTLSMGMSGDLVSAIRAGSSMVRLGTAIFGARQAKI